MIRPAGAGIGLTLPLNESIFALVNASVMYRFTTGE